MGRHQKFVFHGKGPGLSGNCTIPDLEGLSSSDNLPEEADAIKEIVSGSEYLQMSNIPIRDQVDPPGDPVFHGASRGIFGIFTRDQDDPAAGVMPEALLRGMTGYGNLPEAEALGAAILIVACESRGVCGTDMSPDSDSEAATLLYDSRGPPPELDDII